VARLLRPGCAVLDAVLGRRRQAGERSAARDLADLLPDRQGLEDRVFRIKTERSSATVPDTRTSHNIANVEIEKQEGNVVTVRFNWHTLSHRYKTDFSYFGMSRYVVDFGGAKPRILDKYIVLKNDYIHQVIDVYHI
jgi:benzoate/toluate 1,2-dioxygenase beta subunit